MTLLDALDYASVFVFALTGALAASRAQLDIVGFTFVAALTAVGGGTAVPDAGLSVMVRRFSLGRPAFRQFVLSLRRCKPII